MLPGIAIANAIWYILILYLNPRVIAIPVRTLCSTCLLEYGHPGHVYTCTGIAIPGMAYNSMLAAAIANTRYSIHVYYSIAIP